MIKLSLLLGAVSLAASASCLGQTEIKYPAGPVALTVELPHPQQEIFYVHERMPVSPGPLTLYYPKFTPGDHAPDGPIETIMGLEITTGSRRITWFRDEVDMFTFRLTVPAGADHIDISFQFPDRERGTPNLMGLQWNDVALYQAGYPTKVQLYEPTLVIPAGWRYGTALKTVEDQAGHVTFKPVSFNTLVDSPVIAGKYFREFDLTPAGSTVHRYLDVVGDSDGTLQIPETQIAEYRRLVEQAQALFHSHHYGDYHFLLTLSDYVSRGGLEHHQSSDDRARSGTKMFADADHFMLDGSLLPHEYTHSWNGKFMRPAQLWQPDFENPEHAKMLWVYEGLTVYLGDILTVRSGLWSPDTWRQVVAYRAADMTHQPGRDWRPLIDTTVAAQLVYGSPSAWSNWRRQTDFYREGQLLWLSVDMKIRDLSQDRRSIDDFARQLFSFDDGSFVTRRYRFEDVVHALNEVQPYDWASFLNDWIDSVGERVPLLSGIEASGWRLDYSDRPSGYESALENVGEGELEGKGINEMFSVGLFLDGEGKIEDVLWNGPAFKAGLAPGMTLLAIDGRAYSTDVLRSEISEAHKSGQPLQITAKSDGVTALYRVDYLGGLRYPHLVRVPGTTDYLQEILRAKPLDNSK